MEQKSVKFAKHWFYSLSIRSKIMLALLIVSLLSILCVSVVSIAVSRYVILDNTDQMAKNLVKQIAFTLDDRVKSFEDTTYTMLQRPELRQLWQNPPPQLSQKQKEMFLSDAVNQSDALFRYTNYAFLQTTDGDLYFYQPRGGLSGDKSSTALADTKRQQVIPLLSKQNPIAWLSLEGEVTFSRLLVDSRDFTVHGLLFFSIDDSFLDFIDKQSILSADNLIGAHGGNVLFEGAYDSTESVVSDQLVVLENAPSIQSMTVAYQGEKTLSTRVITPRKHWVVLTLIRAADLYQKEKLVVFLDVIIAFGAFALSALLTVVVVNTITRNISKMEDCMTQVEKGDFNARMKPSSYDEVGKLGLRLNYMIIQMETLIEAITEERMERQQLEFQALQAQVNPHFLYNTLGSIKWAAHRKEEPELEAMVDSLIVLLRGSLQKSSSFQTVEEEIHYIDNYIRLQQMRYGNAFSVVYEVEPAVKAAYIPGFLLQPIVENAIYHGIDIAKEDGLLMVIGKKSADGKQVVLQVSDNGAGMSEEKINQVLREDKNYTGFTSIGIKLVHQRLRAYYGEGCTFAITSALGQGTTVKMMVPFLLQPPDTVVEVPYASGYDCGG